MSNTRFTRVPVPGSELARPQIVDGVTVPPPPVVVPDVQVRLDPARNEHTDSGEDTILDVQSDHRFPLLAWIYSIQHQIANSVYTSSPVASPASLLAYTYILYIGLHFHIDSKLRPHPSAAAATILNDFIPLSFFESLLDFALPNFATTEFSTLGAYQDQLAKNLMYFATLAGANLTQDFGRMFPAYAFILLHNTLGTLPNNATYTTLVRTFYGSTVMSLQFPGAAAALNVLPAHLFGRFVDNGQADAAHANHVYRNWFNDVIDRFLTTNAIRVVNATATITRIPIFTPPTIDTDHFNAYLMCTGITQENATQLNHFMRNMHDFVSQNMPSRRLLRDFVTIGSANIASHLQFESAIPTWHTLAVHEITEADVTRASRTRLQFATAITFLVAREDIPNAAAANVIDARRPDDPTTTPANGAIFPLVAETVDPRPALPDTLVRVLDANNINLYDLPRPFIFDPVSNQTEHHGAMITSGLLIESNDISSVGIALPRLNFSLGVQNSDFLGGAIPYNLITPMISSNRIVTRRRNNGIYSRFYSLVHRGYHNALSIPFFSAGMIRLGANVNQEHYPALTAAFPGAYPVPNVRDAYDGINVYIHAIGTPHTVAPEHFILWSSYRHMDPHSRTWYMLPSLRQIYGARSRYSVSAHPADRIH